MNARSHDACLFGLCKKVEWWRAEVCLELSVFLRLWRSGDLIPRLHGIRLAMPSMWSSGCPRSQCGPRQLGPRLCRVTLFTVENLCLHGPSCKSPPQALMCWCMSLTTSDSSTRPTSPTQVLVAQLASSSLRVFMGRRNLNDMVLSSKSWWLRPYGLGIGEATFGSGDLLRS